MPTLIVVCWLWILNNLFWHVLILQLSQSRNRRLTHRHCTIRTSIITILFRFSSKFLHVMFSNYRAQKDHSRQAPIKPVYNGMWMGKMQFWLHLNVKAHAKWNFKRKLTFMTVAIKEHYRSSRYWHKEEARRKTSIHDI